MKVVLQRVSQASVTVGGAIVGAIGRGYLLLVGVGQGDTPREAEWLADKIVGLRLFADSEGKMNLALDDVQGSILAVSQFTLFGDCQKGRRPSFATAGSPELGRQLYDHFVEHLRTSGVSVATGQFQAHMEVALVNDGPVTLLLDTKARE